MDEKTIEDKLKALISNKFSIEKDEITKDTSFTRDLNADSLDLVEMTMSLEDEFDLTVSDKEARQLETYGDVFKYVKDNYNRD
jgi:acyl carrier protein